MMQGEPMCPRKILNSTLCETKAHLNCGSFLFFDVCYNIFGRRIAGKFFYSVQKTVNIFTYIVATVKGGVFFCFKICYNEYGSLKVFQMAKGHPEVSTLGLQDVASLLIIEV